MGLFSATLAAGGAVGVVLGGGLTSALSWRWGLYVNVAFSLVALIGGPRVLPALRGNRKVRIDLGWFRPSGLRLAAATCRWFWWPPSSKGSAPASLRRRPSTPPSPALSHPIAALQVPARARQASSAHPSAQPYWLGLGSQDAVSKDGAG
jgi:MFS family permease